MGNNLLAKAGLEVIKKIHAKLISADHEIFPAHKFKMPTIVGILNIYEQEK